MAKEIILDLLDALSKKIDGSALKQAEESLNEFLNTNRPMFLVALSDELAKEGSPVESRKLAGLILKNTLNGKSMLMKNDLTRKWLSLEMSVKASVKNRLLETLSSPVSDVRSIASQVIAKVAGIELPRNQWPELIDTLLSNIQQQQSHDAKQATLETLGYLCEEVSPDLFDQDQVNKILTAVINNDVRLPTTRSLYNALGYFSNDKKRGNLMRTLYNALYFSNDKKRGNLMRVVCEATLSPELKIRQAAFGRLVAISSSYSDKLGSYMQKSITEIAVEGDVEPFQQAIEFWNSICDEEIDILDVYARCYRPDSLLAKPYCFNLIRQALPTLVPMLLDTLLKQEEDQYLDEGAWNISMAGGTCLGLVARTVGDDIVPLVMPFIEENISKQDWRQREAATYAFGSILRGPSLKNPSLTKLIEAKLNFMLTALINDPNNNVKDTTAWTVGRILKFMGERFVEIPVRTIVNVLLQFMKDVPNVQRAWAAQYYLRSIYWPGYDILSTFNNRAHAGAGAGAGADEIQQALNETLQALNEILNSDRDNVQVSCNAYHFFFLFYHLDVLQTRQPNTDGAWPSNHDGTPLMWISGSDTPTADTPTAGGIIDRLLQFKDYIFDVLYLFMY